MLKIKNTSGALTLPDFKTYSSLVQSKSNQNTATIWQLYFLVFTEKNGKLALEETFHCHVHCSVSPNNQEVKTT